MPNSLKSSEVESYRQMLEAIQARLEGIVEQLSDQALRSVGGEAGGSLSNMPVHMADVGTDSFDQEFTLGLIENEQATLDAVKEALVRIDQKTFGACVECGQPIPRPRLRALPYTPYCVECAQKLESSSS